ncbi:hypothetical protein BDR07DRAFT_1413079 [Suillus spraguei]|nr:hypothetical protein BDR07DRAFT_1413079 [Suillus spraguei]
MKYRNESQANFGRLNEENRQLKREIKELNGKIKELEAENKQQKKKIKQLEGEVRDNKQKVEWLEEEGKRLEIQVTQTDAAWEKLRTKYGFTEAQLSMQSYCRSTDRRPERALNRAVQDLVTQLPMCYALS